MICKTLIKSQIIAVIAISHLIKTNDITNPCVPNKNNVPKIPIPNKVVITISVDNNRLFNLSIFLILFVILINSETFTFYHLLENDVEVALIAANVKVKMKINTATFSNPILTLNIIFKKNFPTASNLFVFVITSTPF